MTRTALLALVLAGCAGGPAPELPNDEDLADLAPARWTPLPPPSGDPVNATPVTPEFWKLGQAACPEGATFTAATPPYFQASCTADGVIHGPTATFDEAGHLLVLEGYVHGQAEGQHLSFWPGGNRKLELAWHLGREHGPFTRWHENGKLAEQGAWLDGRRDGKIQAYDPAGKLLGTSTLARGTGRYTPDGAELLARAGWSAANPAMRELLARAYVDEVASAWSRNDAADVEREPGGDLVVDATISHQGMRGSVTYRETYRITPRGQVHKQQDR